MDYEKLLEEAYSKNIIVKEINFESSCKGITKGNKIAISKQVITSSEKACILAEELAHNELTVGNIIDQKNNISNRKQEYKARLLAYNKMIGIKGIIDCFNYGCRNKYEIANHLNVTEEFLSEALDCYKKIYGIYKIYREYIIYFDPLAIMRKIR